LFAELSLSAFMTRRFPPPWSVEELDACFIVRDHSGQQLAYVYFEDEPGRRTAPGVHPMSAGRQPWETVAPALAGYSVRGTQRVAAQRADERRRRAGLTASTIPAAQSLQPS
jgi:hypothetical protein